MVRKSKQAGLLQQVVQVWQVAMVLMAPQVVRAVLVAQVRLGLPA